MNPCIDWTGAKTHDGYGQKWVNGATRYAHRVAYETALGPIPDGLEIHHLCRNPGCVNAEHLEALTRKEHARLSLAAQKTHCLRGHLFDSANTYIRPDNGRRMCRTCNRGAVAKYRAKKAAQA